MSYDEVLSASEFAYIYLCFMSKYVFEERYYSEADATPEYFEILSHTVYDFADRIVFLREHPRCSTFSVTENFRRMEELCSKYEECAYLIDLTGAEVPNAETRRIINYKFQNTPPNVKHVAFFSGKNFLINTAARFVMYQTKLESFSVTKTQEQALEKIYKVLNG